MSRWRNVRPVKWYAGFFSIVVALSVSLPANAQSRGLHVWYRNAEGCPDGQRFLERLATLGRQAELASVGDSVDFVVTLGPDSAADAAAPLSKGRLERQTPNGTVAIRELRAESCLDVAEALALSLDLALAPAALASIAEGAGASSGTLPRSSEPPSEPEHDAPRVPVGAARSEATFALVARFGLQGTLLTGVAPAPLPGGALFASVGSRGGPSGRVGARVGYRVAPVAHAQIRIALFSGRLEGCPWSWVLSRVVLEPCAALDLGVLHANTSGPRGRSDQGLWASGAAHVRAAIQVWEHFELEAEFGALVPFTRYSFGSDVGSDELFRSPALGWSGAVGGSWNWL